MNTTLSPVVQHELVKHKDELWKVIELNEDEILSITKTTTIIEGTYLFTYVIIKDDCVDKVKKSLSPISKDELNALIEKEWIPLQPKNPKEDWVLINGTLYPPHYKDATHTLTETVTPNNHVSYTTTSNSLSLANDWHLSDYTTWK